MDRSFGVAFIILGVWIGACRADFGMQVTVPDLESSVSSAIGTGLTPLLTANASITANVDADLTGTLGAIVAVINSVNASVPRIYSATQAAVTNKNTSSVVLFSELFGNVTAATLDLVSAAIVAKALQTTVNTVTYNAILGNVTLLENQATGLFLVFSKFEIAADQVKFSSDPVTSANVSLFVTPAIVSELTTSLKTITSAVNSLANLFAVVIKDKSALASQASSITSTSNTAFLSLTSQVSTYSSKIADASSAITANVNSWTSSIVQAVAPINDLLSVSDTFAPDSKTVQKISKIFVSLQSNVLQKLVSQTATTAGALYSASSAITYATISSNSQYASACSSKYSGQLTQPSVQMNRLSSCLAAETPKVVDLSLMLTPLLGQQQKDLTSVSTSKLSTCTKSNGPCVAVYAAAFDTLNTQTTSLLDLDLALLEMECKIMEKRFGTCSDATTADILDNIQIILDKFDNCLKTGQ